MTTNKVHFMTKLEVGSLQEKSNSGLLGRSSPGRYKTTGDYGQEETGGILLEVDEEDNEDDEFDQLPSLSGTLV